MSDPRPPKSPRKGKYVNIRIVFLNDTVHVFQVPIKGTGALLWDAVVNHLQLMEADYFDLEYTNHHGDECWLEKDKPVLKQLGSPDVPLRFCVKFYTPDPGLLEDELTRFLFALQVRKDLLRGELRCSENTASLLASYVVQAELGDFDVDEFTDPTYLTVFKFVPEHHQNHEFMAKVMDYHRQHVGESPSEADLNLLDTARKVELYGVKMWTAKDHENVSLNLAVAHLGVLVFQQHTKINTFSWAKVRKLSFKRKKFLIKLHADTYEHRLEGMQHTPIRSPRGYYKDTVEFFFETRDRCKLFWKRCIEHHAFFRCQMVSKTNRSKSRVVSRGSSFRYSGRTQKQLVEFVRENAGKRPHFERSTSGRISSRSTSVTPKMVTRPQGMHSSSADLQTSSGSRSSGSHILDSNHTPNSGGFHSTPHSATRVESVDVHSDSSMSGSRSLNSPRLEHGLSIDQEVIEAVNARTEGAMTDDEDDQEEMSERREEQEALQDSSPSSHHRRVPHVSSDTKGADCVISPELHSPVRYVGLCSDIYTPDPIHVSSSQTCVGDEAINDTMSNSGGCGRDAVVTTSCSGAAAAGSGVHSLSTESSLKNGRVLRGLGGGDEGGKGNEMVSSRNDEGCCLKGSDVDRNTTATITTPVSTTVLVGSARAPSDSSMGRGSQEKMKSNRDGADGNTVNVVDCSNVDRNTSRSNLDLKLTATTVTIATTNTVSSSLAPLSSSSPSSILTSNVTSTTTPTNTSRHPKQLSSSNQHLKPLTSSSSSPTPLSSSSNTSTMSTACHTQSSSAPSTTSTTPVPLSASQNANKKLSKLKSRSLSKETNQTGSVSEPGHANNVKSNANTNIKFNSLELKRSSSEKTARQVRSSETGLLQNHPHHRQQQQQKRQSPVCGDATAAATTDLSPPFPPPPPPLTPQQLEEEMRRRSLDASPSSCITDAAAQMQQHQHVHHHHQQQQQQQPNQQVRLSSISTTPVNSKMSPLDFDNSSFETQASYSVQSTATSSTPTSVKSSIASKQQQQQQYQQQQQQQQQQQSFSDSDSARRKTPTNSGTLEKTSSHAKDQKTPTTKTSTLPRESNVKDTKKKHLSNGQAVGAGVPTALPQQLAPSESSRKLSAGTDLNEDIPYILRRRLDGQKEETAVFKASGAGTDKLERVQSLDSSSSKQKNVTADPRRRSETRITKPPSDLKLKNVDASPKQQDQMSDCMKRSSSRSPSLTRRVEFVYVNKLPSRNSYSSVDDTASPSKDGEALKQLDLSVTGMSSDSSDRNRANEMVSSVEESIEEEIKLETEVLKEDKPDEKDKETIDLQDCEKAKENEDSTDADKSLQACPELDKESIQANEDESVSENDKASSSGHSVEKPKACKKAKREESIEIVSKLRGSIDETAADGVQFYSPKIPGTRIFKKVIRTSTSDDSPDSVQSPPHIRTSASSTEFSDSQVDGANNNNDNTTNSHQYFEVSKPEVCVSKDSTSIPANQASSSFSSTDSQAQPDAKPVPKSLSLKTETPQAGCSLPITDHAKDSNLKSTAVDLTDTNLPTNSLHPKKTHAAEPSQFLIDLPSPAAALFYSNSSPPQTHDKGDISSSALTFSTFRPDPADEAAMAKLEESNASKSKPSRWSLHSPVDIEGVPDFEVVMSEGAGIIEKSALKKRRNHDHMGRPKEPKRVSWHDDGDVQHSYLSDVSMTAHRSPVEECDASSLFSGMTTPVDSGDILETLENLRRQNSESDMTNSGSSVSSSECSDIENEASAKQIYLQYAKGLSHSSGEGSLDSDKSRCGHGKGFAGSDYGKGISPLRCLESLSGLTCSGDSLEKSKTSFHDGSPLETLEHLGHLSVNDTFDDDDDVAGEDADDEDDDEPNYPPPPPLMDLPDDMLASYESDMPLPEFRDHPCSSSAIDPLDCLEGAAASSSRGSSMVVAVYSSDSDNGAHSSNWRAKRLSMDPLAALELGDLVGNLNCTTSESESDFDADEANTNLRSVSSCGKDPPSRSPPQSSSPPSESPGTSAPTSRLPKSSTTHHPVPPPPPPKKRHHLLLSALTASSPAASVGGSNSPTSPSVQKEGRPDFIRKKNVPPKVLSKPKHFQGMPKTGSLMTASSNSSSPSPSSSTHHSKVGARSPSSSSSTTTSSTHYSSNNSTSVVSPRPLHLNSTHLQSADSRKSRTQGGHPSHSASPTTPRTSTIASPRTPTTPTTGISAPPPPPSSLRSSATSTSTPKPPPTVKSKPKIVSPRQPQMGLGRHYERMRNDSRSSTSSSSSSLASSSSSVVHKSATPPPPQSQPQPPQPQPQPPPPPQPQPSSPTSSLQTKKQQSFS